MHHACLSYVLTAAQSNTVHQDWTAACHAVSAAHSTGYCVQLLCRQLNDLIVSCLLQHEYKHIH
eukprot:7231-Heterococcus_DN1.PRE.1